jgi:hypothetical protein
VQVYALQHVEGLIAGAVVLVDAVQFDHVVSGTETGYSAGKSAFF